MLYRVNCSLVFLLGHLATLLCLSLPWYSLMSLLLAGPALPHLLLGSCFLAPVLLGSFHPPSLSYSLGPLLQSQEILTLFSLTAAIVNKEKSSLCGCFYGKHTLFNMPSITCLTSFLYLTIIKPDFICAHSIFPDAQYTSLRSFFEAVMCLQVCFSLGSLPFSLSVEVKWTDDLV